MVTPDYSFGFFFPLVAGIFALVAFGVGVWAGVADAHRGEGRRLWPLGLYVLLFLAQVVTGFRASEALLVMSAGLVTGPLGYWFGSGFKPHDGDDKHRRI